MFYKIISQVTNFVTPAFYEILYMTIIGSFVGLIIYIIRNVLDNKISAKWKCIMWFIVLVTLLIPFRFEFKIDNSISQNELIKKAENIKNIYEPTYINEKQYYLQDTIFSINNEQIVNQDHINEISNEENNKEEKQIDFKGIFTNIIIPSIWIIGIVVNLITFAICIRNINKKSCKIICKDQRLNNILEKCKLELHINKNIKLVLKKNQKVPSIYGLINTKILIPEEILNENNETIRYIFMHELSHYKRKDMLFNYILLLIVVLHWFNPIIWFLFKTIRQDIELGADELVLEKLDKTEKKEYGLVLINSLRNIGKEKYEINILCMSDDGKNMERRIHMIKGSSKNKIVSAIIAIIVLGIIGGFVFINITEKKETSEVNNDEKISINTEQVSYEKVWQDPKKFNSFEEYENYISQKYSKYRDTDITEEDKSKVISGEEAKKIAKEILEIMGFSNPYIGKPELHKNYTSNSVLSYEIKANDTLRVNINAENGNFINFTDNSFIYNTYETDTISEEEATQIAKDLFDKLGFKEEEYQLTSVREQVHASGTIYNSEWHIKFDKISNENVLNPFEFVAICFIKENGKVMVDTVNTRKDIDSYEDNPIVITESQAIEIAKEKDRKLSQEEIKDIKTTLSLSGMDTFIWAIENNIETSANEEIIDENGEKVTHVYNPYYFDEDIVRKTYRVKIKYDVEDNSFESGRIYYVDTTTGEIIGGSWYYDNIY